MPLDQFKALPHRPWYETGVRHERLCGALRVRAVWSGKGWGWSIAGLGSGGATTELQAKVEAWSTACREVHGSLSDLGAW